MQLTITQMIAHVALMLICSGLAIWWYDDFAKERRRRSKPPANFQVKLFDADGIPIHDTKLTAVGSARLIRDLNEGHYQW